MLGRVALTTDQIIARLHDEADHCYEWSNGPGAEYAVHRHAYRKILYVTAGSITFTPAGREAMELHPGDRLDLPPGLDHGARVGPAGVTCWEGQAKAR